ALGRLAGDLDVGAGELLDGLVRLGVVVVGEQQHEVAVAGEQAERLAGLGALLGAVGVAGALGAARHVAGDVDDLAFPTRGGFGGLAVLVTVIVVGED